MPRHNHDERNKEIFRLYTEEHLPAPVIAQKVDLTPGRILQILRAMDAPMKPPGVNYNSPKAWQGRSRRSTGTHRNVWPEWTSAETQGNRQQ